MHKQESMKITPAQARAIAQVLFPEDYQSDNINAVLKTLDWLREFESEELQSIGVPPPSEIVKAAASAVPVATQTLERAAQVKSVIKRLAAHMKAQGMSVNQLGAELEVNPTTLRTWLLGNYVPRDENLEKLVRYLEAL